MTPFILPVLPGGLNLGSDKVHNTFGAGYLLQWHATDRLGRRFNRDSATAWVSRDNLQLAAAAAEHLEAVLRG